MHFFATCPKNLEALLEDELKALGASRTKQTLAGVKFAGDLAIAYRACLWSRIANRILLPIKECRADTADALYAEVRRVAWLDHMRADGSLVIDFSGTSETIKNSHFGALKVKDAIVDYMRDKKNIRPSIDKDNADLRVNVYLQRNIANLSIDLSGESLHRRGYRSSVGAAPLKENLAAAILYRANWPLLAKEGKPLLDPMCGSATILTEAAMLAADIAPGLMRKSFGLQRWLQHDAKQWKIIYEEAKDRRKQGLANLKAEIRGYDQDPRVIGIAKINVEKAGLADCITLSVKALEKFTPPTHYGNQFGVIVTNPPYGERLGDRDQLVSLYTSFGKVLRERFQNWQVAMLTGNPDLGKTMGIRSYKQYNFFNGAIPCRLLMFKISDEYLVMHAPSMQN